MKIFLGTLLFVFVLALGSGPAFSQVSFTVDVAPPELPVYDQPACPDDGYLWTPGYWAYGDYGYYWVPGTWVQPPEVGMLWTPSYWGWGGDHYNYYPGYWGSEVGFYGGINYGYGYGGDGYDGGRWQDRSFYYNTNANNIGSVNVRNRYAAEMARGAGGNASFNGGTGGVQAQPSARQKLFAAGRHVPATSEQMSHAQAASLDRGQLASANGGRPVTASVATPKSYASVAQQSAMAHPLTKEDSVKMRPASGVKPSAAVAPSAQADTRAQVPAAMPNAAPVEKHTVVAEPPDRPVAVKPQTPVYDTQPRPEAEVQPRPQPAAQVQPRPQAEAQPQSRPQSEVQSRPRPQAESQPQSRSAPEAKAPPRAEGGGQPQGGPGAGAKPEGQANRQGGN